MLAVGTATAITGYAIIIVVAISTSVTAPLLLGRRLDRQHRADRDADWARQDRVAAKAEQAAADLVTSQKKIADQAAEAARLLKLNNERAAETARATHAQLAEIHFAVNSTLTARMNETLAALRAQYALMKQLIPAPSAGESRTMGRIATAIADLEAAVVDRTKEPPE